MASGGGLNDAFAKFATKGGGKECTSKDVTKWCKDAGVFGKECTSQNLDIAFAKVKPKGKTTITMTELEPLIKEISKKYKTDKKCSSEDDAAKAIKDKLIAACPQAHGATKTSVSGNVKGMTDTSKYTGAHKQRFDESGKGKGLEGRADKVENDGYVGDYKGSGTYDKKK